MTGTVLRLGIVMSSEPNRPSLLPLPAQSSRLDRHDHWVGPHYQVFRSSSCLLWEGLLHFSWTILGFFAEGGRKTYVFMGFDLILKIDFRQKMANKFFLIEVFRGS